ncbi:cathepsin G-like isoform X2 [Pelodiscus sinensis]|uniref:cathepsin G-like isoform X2 n=1 Tax=Pelodiscus sinensis TaxID=13735 RepID=UPI003F6C0B3C
MSVAGSTCRGRGGRIIGGRASRPHSRPYMAYVEVWKDQAVTGRCGGLLVRKDFVLTAAHCGCIACNIRVTLGAHDLSAAEDSQQRLWVQRTIPHPEFTPEPLTHDLLLLQLEQPVVVTEEVKPLALPSVRSAVRPGQTCLVAGWGLRSPAALVAPNTLHEVEVEVQDNDTCTMYCAGYREDSMLCAGSPFQRGSAFRGDSGGPLVCNRVPQGLVSYGNINGSPPAVYTRIAKFVPWIRREMRLLRP